MPPTHLPAIWGNRVRERRKAAELSQGQLAQACDISRQHVNRIEQGHAAPSDLIRMRLAEALRTDVPTLFPHEPEPADAA